MALIGDLHGLEFAAVLLALAVARYSPWFPDQAFRKFEISASRLAENRTLAIVTAGVSVVVLRLCLLPWLPVPRPFLNDEFSHLFLADTLLQGRLANPTHLLWRSFETIHIFQQPTNSSMYFPGGAMILALGKLLFGHPWAGLLLSMGLVCSACCWALQGWMPARWAMLGSVFVILRLGLVSYWVNTYFGNPVTALGGALVLGALPRLQKNPRVQTAFLMGLGFVIMLLTRPYEGMLLSIPVALRLAFWAYGSSWRGVLKVLTPVAVCLAICLAGLGVYFRHVTGSATTIPYAVNQQTYGWPLTLPWTTVQFSTQSTPEFRNYFQYELDHRLNHTVPELFLVASAVKAQLNWRLYLGPALSIPLFTLGWWYRNRRIRALLVTGGFLLAMTAITPNYPHYLSPMTVIFAAAAVMGVRHFRHYQYAGVAAGRRFTQMIPLILVLCIAARLAMGARHVPLLAFNSGHLFTSWCCGDRGQVDQTAVMEQLPPGGQHLIVVRYRPWHDFVAQWIYNEPDIDRARVVWARELDPDQNAKLTTYFHNRQVWLFEPDLTPPQLKPYTGASILRHASTGDSAGNSRALAGGATTWGQTKTPDHP